MHNELNSKIISLSSLVTANREDRDRLEKEINLKNKKHTNEISSMVNDHNRLREERNRHLNNLYDIKKSMQNGLSVQVLESDL